jgi:hypothetical protein
VRYDRTDVTTRTLHRIVGLAMLLPFAGWAMTGAVFFIKPGYKAAYEQLAVRTYPLDDNLAFRGEAWREARLMKTILGTHLLVRTDAGWRNLDPATLRIVPVPSQEKLRLLFEDAFTANQDRYGHVATQAGAAARTTTGVDVTLDWNRLSLQQRGKDTDRIDALYRIHYLQWTGVDLLDRVLGLLGLVLLVTLAYLGARLAFARRGVSAPATSS